MTTKQTLRKINAARKAICAAKYYIERLDRDLYRELDAVSDRLADRAKTLE